MTPFRKIHLVLLAVALFSLIRCSSGQDAASDLDAAAPTDSDGADADADADTDADTDTESAIDTEIDTSSFEESQLSQVWANTGEDKVTRDELRASADPAAVINSAWDGEEISLFAAKNEVVAFNLVLEAATAQVDGVSVKLDALSGSGGSISGKSVSGDGVFDWVDRQIELFYIRYLAIKGLSAASYSVAYDERHAPSRFRRPWSGEGAATAGTGWYDRPDADKEYPEIAVPIELVPEFSVEAGHNQSVWVDIYVPKDAAAGTYRGYVVVSE